MLGSGLDLDQIKQTRAESMDLSSLNSPLFFSVLHFTALGELLEGIKRHKPSGGKIKKVFS